MVLEEFAPRNRATDLIEVNVNNLAAVPIQVDTSAAAGTSGAAADLLLAPLAALGLVRHDSVCFFLPGFRRTVDSSASEAAAVVAGPLS